MALSDRNCTSLPVCSIGTRLSPLVFMALLVLLVFSSPSFVSAADCDRKTTLPPPEAGQPRNIDGLKDELKYYVCSGAYNREIDGVIEQAISYLSQLPPKDAKQSAIVLDIDETSLSNWDEISANDFGFIPHAACDQLPKGPCGFDSWQRSAAAQAIGPTLKLFNIAKSKNIAVFFITGRRDQDTARQDTETNLRKTGYVGWTGLWLRPVDDKSNVQEFKTAKRNEIEKQGYLIVANVGDQYSDLNGGHAERAFKLPNPFYFIP